MLRYSLYGSFLRLQASQTLSKEEKKCGYICFQSTTKNTNKTQQSMPREKKIHLNEEINGIEN
jgi:hypothetical protein